MSKKLITSDDSVLGIAKLFLKKLRSIRKVISEARCMISLKLKTIKIAIFNMGLKI
jgi:hypothetical protein